MKHVHSLVKLFLAHCLLYFITISSHAQTTVQIETQAANIIKQLYHKLDQSPKLDMTQRIDWISDFFIGKPYLLGALGEGALGQFDQFPLYRTDSFDCETYVDTVLAIALANDFSTFEQCIRKIRYRDGLVSFIHRNHFASLDWNLNNQKQGFLKDITLSIKNKQNQIVAKNAKAFIDKSAWYQHFSEQKIRLSQTQPDLIRQKLKKLKQAGSQLKSEYATIPYLPLTELFDEQGHANLFLFNQIPNGAIIEIIRPNWDLRQQIGTCLNVSHLGFAIWKNNTLLFRQASSINHEVIESPLDDYLRNTLKSPTIKGINVQIVLPQKTVTSTCKLE